MDTTRTQNFHRTYQQRNMQKNSSSSGATTYQIRHSKHEQRTTCNLYLENRHHSPQGGKFITTIYIHE